MIAPACFPQDLFTTPDARGKGVGAPLIAAVAARAKAAGSPRLYRQTQETNAVARALYDRVAEHSGFLIYRKPLAGHAGPDSARVADRIRLKAGPHFLIVQASSARLLSSR